MRVQPAETVYKQKVEDGVQDRARLRLRYATELVKEALPPGGVLFSETMRKDGHAAQLIQFAWPGVLRVLNPETGELIAEVGAARMIPEYPDEVEFFFKKAGKKKPLLSVKYQPPQSQWRRVTFDVFGVLLVRDLKTREELARSVRGDPLTLCPEFKVLKPDDLKPRLT